MLHMSVYLNNPLSTPLAYNISTVLTKQFVDGTLPAEMAYVFLSLIPLCARILPISVAWWGEGVRGLCPGIASLLVALSLCARTRAGGLPR